MFKCMTYICMCIYTYTCLCVEWQAGAASDVQQRQPEEVGALSQAAKLEWERIANRNAQELVDEEKKEEEEKNGGKMKKKKTKSKDTAHQDDEEAAAGAGAAGVNTATAAIPAAAAAAEEENGRMQKCEEYVGMKEAGARDSESGHSVEARGADGGAAGGAGCSQDNTAVAAASALVEAAAAATADAEATFLAKFSLSGSDVSLLPSSSSAPP